MTFDNVNNNEYNAFNSSALVLANSLNKKTNLNELPEEIIKHILSYNNVYDLNGALLTSHSWNSVVMNTIDKECKSADALALCQQPVRYPWLKPNLYARKYSSTKYCEEIDRTSKMSCRLQDNKLVVTTQDEKGEDKVLWERKYDCSGINFNKIAMVPLKDKVILAEVSNSIDSVKVIPKNETEETLTLNVSGMDLCFLNKPRLVSNEKYLVFLKPILGSDFKCSIVYYDLTDTTKLDLIELSNEDLQLPNEVLQNINFRTLLAIGDNKLIVHTHVTPCKSYEAQQQESPCFVYDLKKKTTEFLKLPPISNITISKDDRFIAYAESYELFKPATINVCNLYNPSKPFKQFKKYEDVEGLHFVMTDKGTSLELGGQVCATTWDPHDQVSRTGTWTIFESTKSIVKYVKESSLVKKFFN